MNLLVDEPTEPSVSEDEVSSILRKQAKIAIRTGLRKKSLQDYFFDYTSKVLIRADKENKYYKQLEGLRDHLVATVVDAAFSSIDDVNFLLTHNHDAISDIVRFNWWNTLADYEKKELASRLIKINSSYFIDPLVEVSDSRHIRTNTVATDSFPPLFRSGFTIYDLLNLAGDLLVKHNFEQKMVTSQLLFSEMKIKRKNISRHRAAQLAAEIQAITPLRLMKVLANNVSHLLKKTDIDKFGVGHHEKAERVTSRPKMLANIICLELLSSIPKELLALCLNKAPRDRKAFLLHIIGLIHVPPRDFTQSIEHSISFHAPQEHKKALERFLNSVPRGGVVANTKNAYDLIMSCAKVDLDRFPTRDLRDYRKLSKEKYPPSDHKIMQAATLVSLVYLRQSFESKTRSMPFKLYKALVDKQVTRSRIRRLIKSIYSEVWFQNKTNQITQHNLPVAERQLLAFISAWPINATYQPFLNHIIDNMASRLGGSQGKVDAGFAHWNHLNVILRSIPSIYNERSSLPSIIELSRHNPKDLLKIKEMLELKSPLTFSHNNTDLALDFICQTVDSRTALKHFNMRKAESIKYALPAIIPQGSEFEHEDFLISIEPHNSLYGAFSVMLNGICININSKEHLQQNNNAFAHLIVMDKKYNKVALWGVIIREQFSVNEPRYVLNNLQGSLPNRWKSNFYLIREQIRRLLLQMGEIFIFNQDFNSMELEDESRDTVSAIPLIVPNIRLDLYYQQKEMPTIPTEYVTRLTELQKDGDRYTVGEYVAFKLGGKVRHQALAN